MAKYCKLLFLILFISVCASSIKASIIDEEGMPVVYLRGSFTNWNINPSYSFTREGNLYILKIDKENEIPAGQFKIADENWEGFDFGGFQKNIFVDESMDLNCIWAGENLNTNGISKATISFFYPGAGTTIDLKFEIENTTDLHPWSGTLPVMYINVFKDENHSAFENEIIDINLNHKNYFTNAEYWIDLNDCEWMAEEGASSIGSEEEPLPLQIKARGNWTLKGFAKKPYKLKLDKKQDLLGLTPAKSKHYALLAHADDNKGYLRNYVGFNLGERIGLPWTPKMQPVEVVINGDYRGVYFLTESIRVGDGRIEIEELEDNISDEALVSGGYVVELDNYDEDNQIRMPEEHFVNGHINDWLRITFDTPEEYSDLQKRFITDQFTEINKRVGSNSDETWAYLDLDDASRYYLVQEIISHVEAFHGSTYLFRDRGEGEKWHFSPLWDCGNAFNGWTNSYFFDCDPYGNTWIASMMANDMFRNKVEETWLWFMQNEYPGIEEDMEIYVARLKKAAKADSQRWKNQPVPAGGISVSDNSDMDGRLKEVKAHMQAKIEWLKGAFGDYTKGSYSEPLRDETPAALLPDYLNAGIMDMEDDNADEPKVYYNLQGIRVDNPQPGQIYIIKRGRKSFKTIYR
ncbi:MAG: CotH kinase family protein [Muribaculaceae bacterium]|nr:CotH kinase family protein [Muribaculaceae bacterium]